MPPSSSAARMALDEIGSPPWATGAMTSQIRPCSRHKDGEHRRRAPRGRGRNESRGRPRRRRRQGLVSAGPDELRRGVEAKGAVEPAHERAVETKLARIASFTGSGVSRNIGLSGAKTAAGCGSKVSAAPGRSICPPSPSRARSARDGRDARRRNCRSRQPRQEEAAERDRRRGRRRNRGVAPRSGVAMTFSWRSRRSGRGAATLSKPPPSVKRLGAAHFSRLGTATQASPSRTGLPVADAIAEQARPPAALHQFDDLDGRGHHIADRTGARNCKVCER